MEKKLYCIIPIVQLDGCCYVSKPKEYLFTSLEEAERYLYICGFDRYDVEENKKREEALKKRKGVSTHDPLNELELNPFEMDHIYINGAFQEDHDDRYSMDRRGVFLTELFYKD